MYVHPRHSVSNRKRRQHGGGAESGESFTIPHYYPLHSPSTFCISRPPPTGLPTLLPCGTTAIHTGSTHRPPSPDGPPVVEERVSRSNNATATKSGSRRSFSDGTRPRTERPSPEERRRTTTDKENAEEAVKTSPPPPPHAVEGHAASLHDGVPRPHPHPFLSTEEEEKGNTTLPYLRSSAVAFSFPSSSRASSSLDAPMETPRRTPPPPPPCPTRENRRDKPKDAAASRPRRRSSLNRSGDAPRRHSHAFPIASLFPPSPPPPRRSSRPFLSFPPFSTASTTPPPPPPLRPSAERHPPTLASATPPAEYEALPWWKRLLVDPSFRARMIYMASKCYEEELHQLRHHPEKISSEEGQTCRTVMSQYVLLRLPRGGGGGGGGGPPSSSSLASSSSLSALVTPFSFRHPRLVVEHSKLETLRRVALHNMPPARDSAHHAAQKQAVEVYLRDRRRRSLPPRSEEAKRAMQRGVLEGRIALPLVRPGEEEVVVEGKRGEGEDASLPPTTGEEDVTRFPTPPRSPLTELKRWLLPSSSSSPVPSPPPPPPPSIPTGVSLHEYARLLSAAKSCVDGVDNLYGLSYFWHTSLPPSGFIRIAPDPRQAMWPDDSREERHRRQEEKRREEMAEKRNEVNALNRQRQQWVALGRRGGGGGGGGEASSSASSSSSPTAREAKEETASTTPSTPLPPPSCLPRRGRGRFRFARGSGDGPPPPSPPLPLLKEKEDGREWMEQRRRRRDETQKMVTALQSFVEDAADAAQQYRHVTHHGASPLYSGALNINIFVEVVDPVKLAALLQAYTLEQQQTPSVVVGPAPVSSLPLVFPPLASTAPPIFFLPTRTIWVGTFRQSLFLIHYKNFARALHREDAEQRKGMRSSCARSGAAAGASFGGGMEEEKKGEKKKTTTFSGARFSVALRQEVPYFSFPVLRLQQAAPPLTVPNAFSSVDTTQLHGATTWEGLFPSPTEASLPPHTTDPSTASRTAWRYLQCSSLLVRQSLQDIYHCLPHDADGCLHRHGYVNFVLDLLHLFFPTHHASLHVAIAEEEWVFRGTTENVRFKTFFQKFFSFPFIFMRDVSKVHEQEYVEFWTLVRVCLYENTSSMPQLFPFACADAPENHTTSSSGSSGGSSSGGVRGTFTTSQPTSAFPYLEATTVWRREGVDFARSIHLLRRRHTVVDGGRGREESARQPPHARRKKNGKKRRHSLSSTGGDGGRQERSSSGSSSTWSGTREGESDGSRRYSEEEEDGPRRFTPEEEEEEDHFVKVQVEEHYIRIQEGTKPQEGEREEKEDAGKRAKRNAKVSLAARTTTTPSSVSSSSSSSSSSLSSVKGHTSAVVFDDALHPRNREHRRSSAVLAATPIPTPPRPSRPRRHSSLVPPPPSPPPPPVPRDPPRPYHPAPRRRRHCSLLAPFIDLSPPLVRQLFATPFHHPEDYRVLLLSRHLAAVDPVIAHLPLAHRPAVLHTKTNDILRRWREKGAAEAASGGGDAVVSARRQKLLEGMGEEAVVGQTRSSDTAAEEPPSPKKKKQQQPVRSNRRKKQKKRRMQREKAQSDHENEQKKREKKKSSKLHDGTCSTTSPPLRSRSSSTTSSGGGGGTRHGTQGWRVPTGGGWRSHRSPSEAAVADDEVGGGGKRKRRAVKGAAAPSSSPTRLSIAKSDPPHHTNRHVRQRLLSIASFQSSITWSTSDSISSGSPSSWSERSRSMEGVRSGSEHTDAESATGKKKTKKKKTHHHHEKKKKKIPPKKETSTAKGRRTRRVVKRMRVGGIVRWCSKWKKYAAEHSKRPKRNVNKPPYCTPPFDSQSVIVVSRRSIPKWSRRSRTLGARGSYIGRRCTTPSASHPQPRHRCTRQKAASRHRRSRSIGHVMWRMIFWIMCKMWKKRCLTSRRCPYDDVFWCIRHFSGIARCINAVMNNAFASVKGFVGVGKRVRQRILEKKTTKRRRRRRSTTITTIAMPKRSPWPRRRLWCT